MLIKVRNQASLQAYLLPSLAPGRRTVQSVITRVGWKIAEDGSCIDLTPMPVRTEEKLLAGTEMLQDISDLVPWKPACDLCIVGEPTPGQDGLGRMRVYTGHSWTYVFKHNTSDAWRGLRARASSEPTRLSKAGTFDDKWSAETWPWPPTDFDAAFWNVAIPDLQVAQPWASGQRVILNTDVSSMDCSESTVINCIIPYVPYSSVICLRGSVPVCNQMLRWDTLTIDAGARRASMTARAMLPMFTPDVEAVIY